MELVGTSSSFKGQSGDTPLIPSWLNDNDLLYKGTGGEPNANTEPQSVPNNGPPDPMQSLPQTNIPIPAIADRLRFTAARNNFSRYIKSGGNNRRSLGRAVSHYIGASLGGPRTAAIRLGSARVASSRLVSFLADAVNRGTDAALKALNLDALVGLPIQEILVGLSDYICPDGGTIDEGIAREAFIETIVELSEEGITNLDELTGEQIQIVFELYAAHAIEIRLYNDIGTNSIKLPHDDLEIERIQAQLNDFIRRGVSDALSANQIPTATLTPDRMLQFVDEIYNQSYEILLNLSEAEEEGV